MFVHDVVNSGAIPVLEMTLRFAGRRQAVIVNNIANLSTPDYRPTDVSTGDFQKLLRNAIDRRREAGADRAGQFEWSQTREVRRDGQDGLRLVPRTDSQGVLFHDRNNRDLERTMQDLAENGAVFRIAGDLLRNRHHQLSSAIAERVT